MANNEQRLKLSKQSREKFESIRRIEQLQRMDPVEFEQFVGYLYQKQGFSVSTTVTSGDEGVDLVLRKGRRLGIVQCKRYAGTVGQPIVRDLYGAMMHNKADEAVLVTSGIISKPAEEWAKGKPIALIDGHELISWARRAQSPVGALPNIPWFTVSAVAAGALALGLLILGLLWGWRTFSDRTTTPPQPTLIADGTKPTATAVSSTPAPAATVTIAPAPGAIQVPRLTTAPTIDGRLDEWAGIPGITTPYVTASVNTWDGQIDLEATWQIGWDEQFLYLGVTVVDNIHVQTQEPKFAYQGDSLELQLDTDLRGDYEPKVSQDDYQFILSPGDFEKNRPGVFRFRGDDKNSMSEAPGTTTQIAAHATSSGYVVEAAIPWADIFTTPSAGLTLGAALSTNDNDTPETAVQEVMFSHVSTRKWRDPTSWGTLTLQP
ncbi:MAG: restriction endonuclease [Anaerolineales bacterium]|nr:restriction endonuclease [Anaerolineales bacterium]